MAWQAIFTSLPEGLVRDQSGFCIAARHEDMPARLLRELERASSYSHLTAPGSGNEDINPTIASHRIWNLGGLRYHVLSRIHAAGLDFSHRSNHIAHHWVFTEDEVANAPSPAHILRAWPGWCLRWNEEPHFLREGERGDLTDLGSPLELPAKNWQEATGNPAHAVLLVDKRGNEQNPCYVAAPLHHPRLARPRRGEELLLNLFEESLLLLEPEKRWQTTFTTFLQTTDNPNEFTWRGWRKGIPLPAVTELGGALVLDLTQPELFPRIEDKQLAGAARGESPQRDLEERALLSPPEDRPRIVITPRKLSVASPHAFPEHPPPYLAQPIELESAWPDWLPNRKFLLGMVGVFGLMVMLFIGTWWMNSRPEPQSEQLPQTSSQSLPTGIKELVDKERETQRDADKKPASLSPEKKPETPIGSGKADKESDTAKAKTTPATDQKNVAAKTPEKQSPSQPTVILSDQQAPIPIYLVMDGDDISGILAKHFGAGINKDTLKDRCQLRAKKADGNLPYTFLPNHPEARVFPETIYRSTEDATLLFKLDSQNPSQLAIRVDKDQKTSHWIIRFSSISSDQQSNEAKPQARVDIDVLLCVAGQPPPFKWGADRLIFDKGRLMLGKKIRQDLNPLQPNLGKTQPRTITLWASFVDPETKQTQQLRSSIWDTPPLNYTNLIVDLTRFTQQFEARLKELKDRKTNLVIQSTTLEKAIRDTRQSLTDNPDLNTACSQLFDCVFINAQKWNFKNFWTASTKKKYGKDLPEWGDYCNYLIYVCNAYIAKRLDRQLKPSEQTRIQQLFWNSKGWGNPNLLSTIASDLDTVFAAEIKEAPSSARFFKVLGQTTEKCYREEFTGQWNRIFSEKINNLRYYLVPRSELDVYAKQIGDSDREIQRIEGLNQNLPKTLNDLTVWLAWDVMEGGKPRSLTLVEFNRSFSNPATTPAPVGTPGPPGGASTAPSNAGSTR